MKPKRKIIGGREYAYIGSTTESERGHVVFQSYTLFGGKKVTIENGVITHPDGIKTDIQGKVIQCCDRPRGFVGGPCDYCDGTVMPEELPPLSR